MCFEKRRKITIKGDLETIIKDILESKVKEGNFRFPLNYYSDEQIDELKILVEKNNLSFAIRKDNIFTNFRIYKK